MVATTLARLDETVSHIAAALDSASAQAAMTVTPHELSAALIELPVLRNRLEALESRIARAAEVSGATRLAGHRSAALMTAAETNAPAAPTRIAVRLARWLIDFPQFEAAFDNGQLGRHHLELIRRQADQPNTHWQLIRDQAVLIDAATELSFQDFEAAVGYWVNLADPDGDIPAEQVRNNNLRVRRQPDKTVTIDGNFDPLLGTAILNAIASEEQKLFAADTDDGTHRSAGARRAHALAGLLARGAARNDGTFPAPLINIVMSETVAEAILARLDGPDIEIPLSWNDIDGRCELIDGTPIHPQLALATFGIARLRRIVMDAASRPLDVSVNARLFPRWMKEAALVATRGRCSEPGCDTSFHWLHADHRQPHSKGGPTRLDNLDPMCPPSNRAKGDQEPEQRTDRPAA